jgi:hypothetical protein
MLYSLITPINKSNAIIDLEKNNNKILDFFQSNILTDANFLEIVFLAQKGYNKENITKADFLNTSCGIIVFSKTAKEVMERETIKDIDFYPCIVKCNGENYEFYAVKIKTYENIINKEASIYRNLSDGRKVIMLPVFLNLEYNKFYFAKDSDFKHIYCVSEKTANLIDKYELNIKLKKLSI